MYSEHTCLDGGSAIVYDDGRTGFHGLQLDLLNDAGIKLCAQEYLAERSQMAVRAHTSGRQTAGRVERVCVVNTFYSGQHRGVLSHTLLDLLHLHL